MSKDNSSEQEHTFKILTIGESGVGKTCILRRFVENKFYKNHLATIGIDFKVKSIKVNDINIKLKVWDTAGQERFRNITTQYYKGADGILLVYDVTDENSYLKTKDWMQQISNNTQSIEIGVILVANKCDEKNRIIDKDMGEKMASELGVGYFETSAATGEGIFQAFEGLAKEIMKKKKIESGTGGVKLNEKQKSTNNKNGGGCCK